MGTAATLRVTGSNNYVMVNKVRQIEAAGRNNHINYYKAVTGTMPRIYRRSGNEVRKGK